MLKLCRYTYEFLWWTIACPYSAWRLIKRYGGYRQVPWRQYMGYLSSPIRHTDKKRIWLHAVSVGEIKAARVLINTLKAQDYDLVITYTTPAARQWLCDHYPDIAISPLPLDMTRVVRLFFNNVEPDLGIILEAEYWPNLLMVAKQKGIRLLLANARLSHRSAKRYRWVSHLMCATIGCFDAVVAQTSRDANRLRCFGACDVIVAGNLKFDQPHLKINPHRISSKTTILLASTREGEEQLLLLAMNEQFWQTCFVILAPRHYHRRQQIQALLNQHKIKYAIRSKNQAIDEHTQLYLADTLGEMDRWYGACDVAIIGGSFCPYGGQNPIEAMALGVNSIIGPYIDNYRYVVRQALKDKALWQTQDANTAVLKAWEIALNPSITRGQAAVDFCNRQQGALAAHQKTIESLLQNPQPLTKEQKRVKNLSGLV